MNNDAPTSMRRLSRWEGWGHVLALFVATRLLLYGAAIVLPYLLEPGIFSRGLLHEATAPGYWLRWDANWYAGIAEHGYAFRPDAQSSVAFFPMMPLSMRLLGFFGVPAWVAGIALANLYTFLLLLVLYRWMRREFDQPAIAETATALVALCPQSCWFILGYTEPLFLLTAVGAIAEARRGRWWGAFLWAAGHGLTRSNGVTIALPLFVIAAPGIIAAARSRAYRTMAGPLVAVIGAWVGHASYLIFLWWRFGTWQANQITSRAGWAVGLALDREHLLQKVPGIGYRLFQGQDTNTEWIIWSWFVALSVTLFAAITLWWKRLPLFWNAYLVAFWSLFLLTAQDDWLTHSIGRYAAALFPVALVMALLAEDHPWSRPIFYAINGGAAIFITATVFAGYHYY